jgi:hypothetical protein
LKTAEAATAKADGDAREAELKTLKVTEQTQYDNLKKQLDDLRKQAAANVFDDAKFAAGYKKYKEIEGKLNAVKGRLDSYTTEYTSVKAAKDTRDAAKTKGDAVTNFNGKVKARTDAYDTAAKKVTSTKTTYDADNGNATKKKAWEDAVADVKKIAEQEAKDQMYKVENDYDVAYDAWKASHDAFDGAEKKIESLKTSLPAAKKALEKAKWDKNRVADEAAYEKALSDIAAAEKLVTDLTTEETNAKETRDRQTDDVKALKTALDDKKGKYDTAYTKYTGDADAKYKPTKKFDPAADAAPVAPADPK